MGKLRSVPNIVPPLDAEKASGDINDVDYDEEKRKRDNEIALFDHRFRKYTHPFALLVYIAIIGGIYAVAWVLGTAFELRIFIAITNGIKASFGYVATAVFSFMFSRFMDSFHSNTQK